MQLSKYFLTYLAFCGIIGDFASLTHLRQFRTLAQGLSSSIITFALGRGARLIAKNPLKSKTYAIYKIFHKKYKFFLTREGFCGIIGAIQVVATLFDASSVKSS